MNPAAFLGGRVVLHAGDCIEVMRAMPEASVDAVVTDPPYHLTSIVKRFGKPGSAECQFGSDGAFRRASAGFMGQVWDGGDIAFRPETWAEVLRVLKPGGHLVAFAAPLIEREAEYCADIERRMAHVREPARVRKQTIVTARGKTEGAGPLFASEAAE